MNLKSCLMIMGLVCYLGHLFASDRDSVGFRAISKEERAEQYFVRLWKATPHTERTVSDKNNEIVHGILREYGLAIASRNRGFSVLSENSKLSDHDLVERYVQKMRSINASEKHN